MVSIQLSPLNSRFIKTAQNKFEVLIACENSQESKKYDYEGLEITV